MTTTTTAGANAFNSVHDSAIARIDGSAINAGGGAVTVSALESSSIVGTAVSASVSVAVSVIAISVAGAESVVKSTIGNQRERISSVISENKIAELDLRKSPQIGYMG